MVDFALFYSLDPYEARSLLEGFLETEARATEQMLIEVCREGLEADFSVESHPPLSSVLRGSVGGQYRRGPKYGGGRGVPSLSVSV